MENVDLTAFQIHNISQTENVRVATNISVVYYDEMPVGDKMQQTLYKQGYIGYILVNVSCLLDKNNR